MADSFITTDFVIKRCEGNYNFDTLKGPIRIFLHPLVEENSGETTIETIDHKTYISFTRIGKNPLFFSSDDCNIKVCENIDSFVIWGIDIKEKNGKLFFENGFWIIKR